MLMSCSWQFYCRYVLKLPPTTNSGASRGLCVHDILEYFVSPKHKKHFLAAENGQITPAVGKLIKKLAVKRNVGDEDNLNIIKEMITVACKYDFFGLKFGAKSVIAEQEFNIEFENFIINGFIDKTFLGENGIKVIDYKSSKAKFSSQELESNIQAMMYSLAMYKIHKEIPTIEFLFLKFSRNPFQFFEKCSEDQLNGFESYLGNIANYIEKFNEKTAVSMLAVNDPKKKWQCGKEGAKPCGTKNFICEYRKPFEYWQQTNDKNEIIKTSFNENELEDGLNIKKVIYSGCPAFSNRKEDDFF